MEQKQFDQILGFSDVEFQRSDSGGSVGKVEVLDTAAIALSNDFAELEAACRWE